jgi:hypothetical protein
MTQPSNSVRRYLDSLDLVPKRTGVAIPVELVAYPDGHAALGRHPLNHKAELMRAVDYLFERAFAEATRRSATRQ